MSDYYCFLSYAREDRDQDRRNCIRRFYEDLEEEVRTIAGLEGNVCFFDGNDCEPGNDWPDALSEALCTSRVFVPIYSPTYFRKDYCGREWKIFSDRLETYRQQNSHAKVKNLIQPVFLVPPESLVLPDSASRIQYKYDEYQEDYRKQGLRFISKVDAYKDSYEKFITELARRIVDVADEYYLPPLDPCPDIEQTISAFHQPGVQIPGTNGISETGGPRYVQFIFVAGRRDELQEIRNTIRYYGPEGGLDWRPFLPEVRDEVDILTPHEVAILAQRIATDENLHYEHVPLDADTIQRLKEAKDKNKMVAIIVDPWTLRLERYYTFIRPYDDLRDFLNSVVLIPWNPECEETQASRTVLEYKIQNTFRRNWEDGHPHRFLDSINSLDELRERLRETLLEARRRIMRTKIAKKAEGPQPPRPTIEGSGV